MATRKAGPKPSDAAPTKKPATKVASKAVARTLAAKPAAKPAAKLAAKPAAKPVVDTTKTIAKASAGDEPARKQKPKKVKVVRDSFTMPETEYAVLAEVKKACLSRGFQVKKSELLRVGVALIRTLDAAALKGWVESLPPLKLGRPSKEKQA
jgi:uncharacterized iron-regulated protein